MTRCIQKQSGQANVVTIITAMQITSIGKKQYTIFSEHIYQLVN